MISPIRGLGLLLLALAVSGCATRSACAPHPYQEARAVPPLTFPEGVDAPDQRNALRIPARQGASGLATDADGCVIEPPLFYADAGQPNPEGLPLRPSSVAATGVSPVATGASRVTREVTAFLNEWASAWSRRDADAWLVHYRADYAPAGYAGADEWQAEQRERFQIPATTRIDPNSVVVEPQPDGSARVRFTQHFGEAPEQRSVVKELVLLPRTGGGTPWQIVDERIADVL